MKKTLLSIIVVVACCFNHPLSAQAIPDSSFSVWTHNSTSAPYDDPNAVPLTGAGWQELNFATSPLWGASPASVFKDSVNYHSSKYSAKIVTTVYNSLTAGLLKLKIDTSGIMFLGTIDFLSGKLTSGIPYTGRPANLKFWYEYAPVSVDTCFVYCMLTKWNSIKGQHDTVATGLFWTDATVSSFTQASATFNYTPNYLSSGNSDTIIVYVSSCSTHHNKPNPGSTLWLDDFTWGPTFSGISDVVANSEMGKVYPNPAKNSITFTYADNKVKTLHIYDVTGRQINSLELTGSNTLINTETFNSGVYLYRVMDNSGYLLQTGKFSIVK